MVVVNVGSDSCDGGDGYDDGSGVVDDGGWQWGWGL